MRDSMRILLAAATLAVPATGQIEVQRVLPETAAPLAWFGGSIDLEGDTLVIPERGPRDVYLFQRTSGEWVQSQRLDIQLTHTQGNYDGWGIQDVDLSGDWLAVGVSRYFAPSSGPQANQGEVQIFRRTAGHWSLSQVLVPGDMVEYDMFPWDLALDGDTLVVGSPHYTNLANPCTSCPGSVYVYELGTSGAWGQAARILAPANVHTSTFGRRVALDGPRALATSIRASFSSFERQVEVLERSHGQWRIVDELAWGPEYTTSGDHAVALDGDTALVGSPNFHSSTAVGKGAVLVWEKHASGWTWTATLTPSDAQAGMFHHQSLALSGDDAILAAPSDWKSVPVGSGSVYHFQRVQGAWQQVGKLASPRTIPYSFGQSVALEGLTAVVATHLEEDLCPFFLGTCSGAGYVFELASHAQQYCACDSGPCAVSPNLGGCVNSTGKSAFLVAGGSASVALDELLLEAHWLPPQEVALVLQGGAATALPFGDGQLCVAPGTKGLFRFHAAITGAGDVELGPGIVAWTQASFPPTGQIQAGDTWYFQCWYRDLAGTCGSSSNLTNGVQVEFVP